MTKTGYFEESPGNKSSSRLNSTIVIMAALLYSGVVLFTILFKDPDNILTGAGAAASIFTTLSGVAMFYQNAQKKVEVKQNNDQTTA